MPSALGLIPIKQMEGLYPIIRRVRRPLLPVENPTQLNDVSLANPDAGRAGPLGQLPANGAPGGRALPSTEQKEDQSGLTSTATAEPVKKVSRVVTNAATGKGNGAKRS